MAAFIWNANPGKWDVVPPATDGWGALRDYVSDDSSYVYWSTPTLHSDIQVDDMAIIWRNKFRGRMTGIIAMGRVAERPRQLTDVAFKSFSRPERIKAPGWNEAGAPSKWKTGIVIEKTYWDFPVSPDLKISQGSVRRLSESEVAEINRAIGSRPKGVTLPPAG